MKKIKCIEEISNEKVLKVLGKKEIFEYNRERRGKIWKFVKKFVT